MKKFLLATAIVLMMASAVPSYAFLDYLFSGSASRDAIDNSALGDLRAWWTGNPAYQFNPYYSGPTPGTGQAGPGGQPAGGQGSYSVGGPQAPAQQLQQQPGASYYPPQAPQGYGQYPQQPAQPGYGSYAPQAGPQYQPTEQQYQAMPQQYQAAPQQYQAMPQQYQAAPQQYQAMPQQYQAAPQQQYQAMPQQYQAMPQQYQTVPQSYQGSGQ